MSVALSWSAGKDSMLALVRAREQGLAVTTLLTMCEEGGLSKSHALAPELIQAQADALGLAWRPVRVPAEPGGYARAFGAAYDADLLARLPAHVCPCGEDGEFHTFVTDGPGFAQPVNVVSRGRRRVAAAPPLSPTELVFDELALA
jgi:diphthamide synthase (EF-2-diphthine--ammonia ligase)